jgi:hypothetical protein
VAVAIWVVAPNALVKAVPLLLLAACPLSMLLMMWVMNRGMKAGQHTPQPSPETSPTGPRLEPGTRLAELQASRNSLDREIAQVRNELEQPEKRTPSATEVKQG